MAHHGDNPVPYFGPTGKFPRGKLNADDEGEIQFGITNDGDTVIVQFGQPTAWVGMTAEQAESFADSLKIAASRAKLLSEFTSK